MTEKATFAAGCFWGVEAAFRQTPGVRRTTVGYTGGTVPNATYEQVCSGTTGHAEAVEVEFDPAEVSYEQLLETFWASHNPTQRNRQGWDIGTQYRSAVFVHTPEQEEAATRSRDEQQARIDKAIVTEITPAAEFWQAEDYHQRYLEKRGRASCAVGVADAEPAQPSWLSTVTARLGGRD